MHSRTEFLGYFFAAFYVVVADCDEGTEMI